LGTLATSDRESIFDMLPINQVLLGDAIEVLKSLPDNSVDALITDPRSE